MLVGWADDEVRRACSDPEVGHALWGAAGWNLVQELLVIAAETGPLGELTRFASVDIDMTAFRNMTVVSMRYRSAELIANPYRADGPIVLAQEDHDMRHVKDADRLLIRDVRCGGLSPVSGATG